MAQIRTLVGELAYLDSGGSSALLAVKSVDMRAGGSYQEIKLNLTPRLTMAYRNRQVIPLDQLRIGQVVEVLGGYFDEDPKELFVMAITVKD